MASLFTELKRRNVFKVAAVYVVVAWLLLQVADVLLDNFGIPEWGFRFVTILLIIGFPIALIFAWAFEMTPEGLKRDRDVDHSESITQRTGQKLNYVIIGLLVVALAYYAYQHYFVPDAVPTDTAVVVSEAGSEQSHAQPSIAVLPFANRSADAENAAFFADGIHDDLLTILSKIGDLKVISRTSVERYRETDKPIPEIAVELGVGAILEGGVQRAGDRVRINMQLIDGTTDEHLWADSYDEELTAENVFDIQRRIAENIAESLQATLSPREQADIADTPTLNLAAYDAYLRGRERKRHETTQSLAEAQSLFEQAIELDPDFVLAWVGLADSYVLRLEQYFERNQVPDIEAAIEQALELDPNNGEANVSLGTLRRLEEADEESEAAYKRALQLNPGYADAWHRYGSMLLELRRYDEALSMLQRAAELDPLSPAINVDIGAALEANGDFDAALNQYRAITESDPEYMPAWQAIGWLYWSGLGKLDEAARWYRKALEVDPGNYGLMYFLVELYLDLQDYAAAEELASRMAEREDTTGTNGFMLIHATREENAEAEKLARNILATQEWPVIYPALVTIGDVLMRTGRFEEAVALYQEYVPHLLEEYPEVDFRYDRMSLQVAAALLGVGERERAMRLLDGARAVIATGSRHGPTRYDIAFDFADIENLALRGETEEALARMREAVDAGWRVHWAYTPVKASMMSLHDNPEFQSMVAELRADAAAQRQRLREADTIAD